MVGKSLRKLYGKIGKERGLQVTLALWEERSAIAWRIYPGLRHSRGALGPIRQRMPWWALVDATPRGCLTGFLTFILRFSTPNLLNSHEYFPKHMGSLTIQYLIVQTRKTARKHESTQLEHTITHSIKNSIIVHQNINVHHAIYSRLLNWIKLVYWWNTLISINPNDFQKSNFNALKRSCFLCSFTSLCSLLKILTCFLKAWTE